MTINTNYTISTPTTDLSVANGDDPLAILQALQGYRYEVMSKALGSTADATLTEMRRAARIREYQGLVTRLQAMPDTPDGSGKVLATFSAGNPVNQQQVPDATVMTDLDALQEFGLTLPTQKWCYVYQSDQAQYPADSTATSVLMSPEDIAQIQRDCPLVHSADGVDYYERKTGSGANEKTSYIAVFNNEGAYCAKDADITELGAGLGDQVDQATKLLTEQSDRLGGLSSALLQDLREDQPLMKLARHEQARHDERYAALQVPPQGTPPDLSKI